MSLSDYSYLDLTVMPFLRKKVISGDAAILFNAEFSKVLWANAIGAELFGGEDIYSLLEIDLSDNHPLIRQLVNASKQIDNSGPVTRGFRVARGLKSDLMQGEISKITLPNEDHSILVVFEASNKSSRLREHELAMIAVEALEGFADAAAIVDDYGLVLASTHGFDRYEIDPETLESLINIVADEDDRLVKRKVETASGKLAAAGFGRIRDTPGRFLVVMADAADEENEELVEDNTIASVPLVAESATTDQTADVFVEETPDEETGKALPWEDEPTYAENEAVAEDGEPVNESVEEPLENDEQSADETGNGSLLDRWYFSEQSENVAAEETSDEAEETREQADEQAILEDASSAPMDMGDAQAAPIRFAFSIDQDQIVQSVSDELIQAVGETSGDIAGKHWADIAASRKFDDNGAILALLKKADTWSGKSIFWPIDNTDMVVPVDLAALPVFDRERNFDGFKGFGIIRMNDAVIDPSGTGYAIDDSQSHLGSNNNAPSTETSDHNPSQTEDQQTSASYWQTDLDSEEGPDQTETVDTPDVFQAGSGNVFQLPRREAANDILPEEENSSKTDPEDENLSSKEQRAFSEISRSLADQIEDEHRSAEAEFDNTASIDQSGETLTPLEPSGSVLETLPVPLVIYNSEKTLFANQALLELAGYESTEDLETAGGLETLLNDISDHGDVDAKSPYLMDKKGEKISVQSKLTSVDWYGQKALCLTFAANETSVDDEKTALDMIRVSELENILETAADGILVIDEDGKIETLNASGEALFGRDQRELIGKSFGKLFATESRDALEKYINDLNAPGVSSVLNQGQQVIGVEANGGLIPLFATIGRVGQANRYCAVLRDLTEWKKSEEELVNAKRKAETASEQKTEFLSRISHEIREPLNAIIGFSDVMIEERFGKVDNERYREYLKDINRSGIHVLDLVNDLLDISKIEAGKLELSYEAVDLNQLAAETVALLQPQANNKRILIRTSLSRAVPKVVADARSIRQIILNLVSNAINHSPTNSQVIVSTTFEENSEVGLRIRDTGPGMSADELEKAIEPFAQVGDERMSQTGGTGLGLPLTKALVEANRAYFELESNVGEGTIAHIQFPSQRVLAD